MIPCLYLRLGVMSDDVATIVGKCFQKFLQTSYFALVGGIIR